MSDESAADAGSIPRLRPHFRFQWEPAQDAYVLLYPEGMIKLNGSAGEIMASIDGERSVDEIVATLERKFPEAGDLRADIVEFLSVAHDKRWIEFS